MHGDHAWSRARADRIALRPRLTRKRSLVQTQYRPPARSRRSEPVLTRICLGQGTCGELARTAVEGPTEGLGIAGLHLGWGEQAVHECRSSRGVHSRGSGSGTVLSARRKSRRTLAASSLVPAAVAKTTLLSVQDWAHNRARACRARCSSSVDIARNGRAKLAEPAHDASPRWAYCWCSSRSSSASSRAGLRRAGRGPPR